MLTQLDLLQRQEFFTGQWKVGSFRRIFELSNKSFKYDIL